MGLSCGLDNSTSNFTPDFEMSFSILESAQIVEQERVKIDIISFSYFLIQLLFFLI